MLTKVPLVKAMVFPVVMYRCESWTIKKPEPWRTDAFELWCWRRLLRVLWTARRFNQSVLKEISPEYSLEGLMLKLKLQYFWCEELTHWKRPWCWERLKAGGEGDDRGWDSWMASLTQWTWVWVSSGSWWWTGILVCCSPWGRKELDTTEWLNWPVHLCAGTSVHTCVHMNTYSLQWFPRIKTTFPTIACKVLCDLFPAYLAPSLISSDYICLPSVLAMYQAVPELMTFRLATATSAARNLDLLFYSFSSLKSQPKWFFLRQALPCL